MSVEFDTPANRVITQFQPKNQFTLQTNLPDITFLRHLSVLGRLRYNIGSGAATITLTPNTGETLFFYGGLFGNSSGAAATTYTITNNGTTRMSFTLGLSEQPMQLTNIMDSLVGDGSKTFTITGSGVGSQFNVFTWVENTSRIRDVTS